ncbi:MAG: hypothetical protein LYZ69_09140 [Nitrososphaerales archaeon]|nr:hypothetical protein [Nitrososphaerales archaeon]
MSQPSETGAGSVSKIACTAQVRGRGNASVSLYRHLAPLTVNAILRALPIESRVSVQPAMASLFTDIRVGVEKPRLSLERGDIAFLASGSLLCIFLRSVKSERPLNPLGKVESGIEALDTLKAGDVVRLALDVSE